MSTVESKFAPTISPAALTAGEPEEPPIVSVEATEARCWPSDHLAEQQDAADIRTTIRTVLADPQVTIAVLQLRTLASPGGVLDDLESAGYEIVGPDWR